MTRSFISRPHTLCLGLLLPLAMAGCRENQALKAEQEALEKKIVTIEDQFGRMETMVKVERSRVSQLELALKQARADLAQSQAELEQLRQAPMAEAAAATEKAKVKADEPMITGRTIPSVKYKGETYKNVKVHYVHNGEVKVSHSGGVGRWKIELFPPDMHAVLWAENQTGETPSAAPALTSFEEAVRPMLPPALPPVPPVRRPGTSTPPPASAGAPLEDEIVPTVSTAESGGERDVPSVPIPPLEPNEEPASATPQERTAPAPASAPAEKRSPAATPSGRPAPPAFSEGEKPAGAAASAGTGSAKPAAPSAAATAARPRPTGTGAIIEAPPPRIGKVDEVPAVVPQPAKSVATPTTTATPVAPPPGGENSGLLLPPR